MQRPEENWMWPTIGWPCAQWSPLRQPEGAPRCALDSPEKNPLSPCFLGSVWGAPLVVTVATVPFDSWPRRVGPIRDGEACLLRCGMRCGPHRQARSWPPALSCFAGLDLISRVGAGLLVFTSSPISSITARACFTSVCHWKAPGLYSVTLFKSFTLPHLLEPMISRSLLSTFSDSTKVSRGKAPVNRMPEYQAARSTKSELHLVSLKPACFACPVHGSSQLPAEPRLRALEGCRSPAARIAINSLKTSSASVLRVTSLRARVASCFAVKRLLQRRNFL